MTYRLRRALDFTALVLLATGLLATLAIISHDPADPPGATVAPAHETSGNLLGETGTSAARLLLDCFGVTIYPFLAALLVLVLTLLLEGRRGAWCWRLLGWCLLVPSLALAGDQWDGASGGELGMALAAWLSQSFQTAGVLLIMAAGLAVGLALAGDFIWPTVVRVLIRGWRQHHQKRAQQRAAAEKMPRRANVQPMDVPAIPVRRLTSATEEPMPTAAEPAALSEPALAELPPPQQQRLPTRPMTALPEAKELAKRLEPPQVRRPAPLPSVTPANDFQLPPFELLEDPEPFPSDVHDQQLRERAVKL